MDANAESAQAGEPQPSLDDPGVSQRDPDVSWIAKERMEPGVPSNRWILSLVILSGAAFLVLAFMALSPIARIAAEDLYRAGDGPIQALDASIAPHISRTLRAAAAAALILGTGFAARRLLHDEGASVIAAGLLILDPAFLVHGRLSTPIAFATAGAMVALALFLSPRRTGHWLAAGMLAIACFFDPRYLLWGFIIGILVLVRGHIYAAPRHAAAAAAQTLGIPLIGAAWGMLAADSLGPTCYTGGRFESIFLLQHVDLGNNIMWHPNPALWFAGLGALAWLGGGALWRVLSEFRLQRLPGRVQVRLTGPLRRGQARALWLLVLVAFAPSPSLWAPLLAMAVAASVQELGRGSKRFGLLVAIAVLALTLVFTVRLWPMLVGATPTTSPIPWSETVRCG